MVSGPSNEGGGVDVDKDYNPAALPTICLIAPNKDVVEKDIWPANTILSTLEKYQFTPIVVDDPSDNHQFTSHSSSYIKINTINPDNITISVSENNNYTASIYSLDGVIQKILLNNYLDKGTHSIPWYNKGLAKGLYILNVGSRSNTIAKKFVLE